MPNRPAEPDAAAIRRARRIAPELTTAEALTLREGADLPPDDPMPGRTDGEAAEGATLHDWAAAEAARPTLPDENDDGLSEQDEALQRAAEDPVSIRRSRQR